MNKIGILYHPLNDAAQHLAQELASFLQTRNITVWLHSAWEENSAGQMLPGTELLFSIGGDGTILRVAQIAFKSGIPITGINMGTLGFMTELTREEAFSRVDELLSGGGWLDERAMLEVEVSQQTGTFYALNDVVIARGAVARTITIEAWLNGELFTIYRADGVILSTATGSTGYNLAAGGPVLYFNSPDIIFTPIVPHLGLPYSLVLSSDTLINLRVKTPLPATLSIDGHINLVISEGTFINVRHSPCVTRFLRIHQKGSFYRTLQCKLKGK